MELFIGLVVAVAAVYFIFFRKKDEAVNVTTVAAKAEVVESAPVATPAPVVAKKAPAKKPATTAAKKAPAKKPAVKKPVAKKPKAK